MIRFFNPADLLTATTVTSTPVQQPSAKFRLNPALPEMAGQVAHATIIPRKRRSPIRATQGTVRAMRLVRRAAVAKFGRGKTKLEYRQGRWVVHLYNFSGDAVGLYVAYDAVPGVDNTGVDFQLVPAAVY